MPTIQFEPLLKVFERLQLQPSFGRTIAAIASIALAVVIASHVTLFFETQKFLNETLGTSAKSTGQNAANNISNVIGLLRQSLAAQANDTRLAAILAQSDPALIQKEEERITEVVPGALLLRLVPGNLDVPDDTRSPRMGFAGLNMVRNAAKGPAPPGIHQPNTPEAHLAMAQRLPEGGGVILASWPVKILEQAMASEGACGIELRQENFNLLYRGKPACKEKEADGEVPIIGTPWKIAYWMPHDLSATMEWFGAALGISLVLIGTCAFWLNRRLARVFFQDRQNLALLALDIVKGNSLVKYPFVLVEMSQLSHEIVKLKRFAIDYRQQIQKPEPVPPKYEPVSELEFEEPEEALQKLEFRMDVTPVAKPPEPKSQAKVSPAIFRAYDILGVVGKTLTREVAYAIGKAIGAEMQSRGEQSIAIARDGRPSGSELSESLAKGLMDSGRHVINLGLVPTPALYFAAYTLADVRSGVIVTGGHNPAEYNGIKMVIGGSHLAEASIQQLRRRIENNEFVNGVGRMESHNVVPEYIDRVLGDTQLGRNLKIVMDCGNGAASVIAPELFRSLGCEVVELFCEMDGNFPNHPPDPIVMENLQALIDKVLETGADLGIAFDGDGDRLGVVDSGGRIIWPDRQMMAFAVDVLSREPGSDIVYDVKCSRHLPSLVVRSGGRPMMCKSGHNHIHARIKETGAMLGGEMSGHIYFQERWFGFDDAIYAAARMAEIVSNAYESSAEFFSQYPDGFSTPELKLMLEEGEKLKIMERLREAADFPNARITEIDGLRVDFPEGWGLVRASTSQPALTFRFEADSELALAQIQQRFKVLLQTVKPGVQLPF